MPADRPLLLGVDLGTLSVKTLVLDADGAVVGRRGADYEVFGTHDRPGWAESDPIRWETRTANAVRGAVKDRGRAVKAIGLSGQMHGVVLCDAAGETLRRPIIWSDSRSQAEVQRYRELDAHLLRTLRNPLSVGMAGPTLLWLRDHEPDVYRRARWALQPKDWLRLRWTGVAASEPSDASATLLYDLEADTWSAPVCAALGLRTDLLAPLTESGAIAGELTDELAENLGLPAGVPVAAGAGDTAAAALGSGLIDAGPVQLTVGSGAQIVTLCDRLAPEPLAGIHCFRAALPQRWYRLAAMQNCGLALEWVREIFRVLTWDEMYQEAASVPPGAGGVTFVPFLTGERTPYFSPEAFGAFTGLRTSHRRAHVLRAALEGTAFAIRDGLAALEATGVSAPELRLAGGGSLNRQWRQLLADVLSRPLLPAAMPAASARGAALLAGIAAGVVDPASDLVRRPKVAGEVVTPRRPDAYEPAWQRYRHAVARTLTKDSM